jgi:transposase
LAEIAQRLGRKALEELAAVAKPDTLLAWYRKLIANKFDGSKFRQRVGRPRMDEEAERLVVQMAKENPSWGYDRIVGALANLDFLLSHQTVGNILRRHGLSPAPKRKQAICWRDFIRSHTRNATMEGWGFLRGCRYLLHDRDTKFCASFRELLESGSVKTIRLPV